MRLYLLFNDKIPINKIGKNRKKSGKIEKKLERIGRL